MISKTALIDVSEDNNDSLAVKTDGMLLAGVDIDTIVTPFGSIGLMVIDPDIMPTGSAFILDLAYIQPVFTNIPGYGTVFVRDLDQDANARIGKAVYMEMGFEFGPPSYHCKIQAVA